MNPIGGRERNLFILMLAAVVMLVSVQSQAAEYYTWPTYSPTLEYDYFDEYGEISQPSQVCPDGVTGVAGTYIDGWWCFRWGSNKNPEVTEADWVPMLQRFNEDFDYITNIMRWPRDKRVLDGYYSTVYLYGSGLSTDNADPWDTGGWQSSAGGYPMVLASYYPVHCFDPSYTESDKEYQCGAMIHEGIHCILASMPGCFNSCWFHEGGNTWLQGTMEGQRAGDFSSIGWLSAGAAIAPFMPIECYSGWLQDDSFGGPCAEGVNMYQGDQQICTWRNLLGGTQYGECFPHALEIILGPKSVAWIWRNASQSGRVLQDMAEVSGGLGDTQMRRLIKEYRARQAFCDFGQWSYAFRQLLNNNWNVAIEEEWSPYWIDCDVWYATCYVDTTQNGSVLTPEDRTLPGWSGANQIPLTVSSSATEASVTFNPIGSNMSCQLVYRNTSGDILYGPPVSSGTCSIPLANVMNNVIVAVICNTDYIYYGESTRTAKYDYTLTMGTGITGKADINTQWYAYSPSSYTLTASAAANGTISPSGNVVVTAGNSQTFTFTPNSGYEVDEVILNGLPIGALTSYTFNNVHGDHTISVTFKVSGGDETPPTPNPATWSAVPAATGTDTITMTATTGSDASGVVEYYFDETTGNPGGSDSGWQSSASYTDTGLSSGTQYTYRVQMRDAYNNTGSWSTSESATTQFTGVANIALFATASTSYVSSWETLEAVQDGYEPSSSSDYTHGAYGNWQGEDYYNTWNWVEYDFGQSYQINSTDVYWWDDGAGIEQPYDAYIEYWNGGSWVNAGSIGVALDQWNTLVPSGVVTSGLRINMISTMATGILEWQVWGQEPGTDTDPPTPNPATWESVPAAISSSEITMTATTGSDASGPVEYYFEETTGNPGGSDSGWQTSSSYTDTGLSASTQYTYRVQMRDSLSNTGDYSTSESATTQAEADTDPPTPNPATWESVPTATGTDTITMTATTGSDASPPVEYYFDETSGNSGGSDSGWQTSPSYTDTGLSADTQYTYRVQMRDSLGNTGSYSTSESATTQSGGSTVLASADFESGFGEWVNVTGDTDDWLRNSGSTPSSSTGPSGGANGSTWYVYLETSSGYANSDGDTAYLEGPDIGGSDRVLSFYYHMYGSNMGTLNVDVYDGSWNNGIWSISGQQHSSSSAAYTQANVSLSSYTGTIKIRFRGVAAGGYRGDMAIDDIEVTGISGGEDTDPPTPNPATWATEPYATGTDTITMTATTGSDASGVVEYYFDETSGNTGGSDSGWQSSATYTDTGLSAGTQYTYTVQMRDAYQNTGTASSPASATTQEEEDTDPPTPNPATWASVPSADSSSAISMTATTGSDQSGPVEYYFEETSGNAGGSDSGWQTNSSYTDTGLSASTQYTYRVQMRDSLGNTGSWSTSESATTQSGGGGEVFYDSFENGEWNGLWTEDSQADWYDSTQRSTDGSYSAEVDGSATDATLTSILIDLQGSSNATVTFDWYIERGLDSGEYLAFDVSTDGGSNWTQRAILQGNVDTENTWHNESIDVTGISSGNLQIRFRGRMNRSNEDADVDNVSVTAW